MLFMTFGKMEPCQLVTNENLLKVRQTLRRLVY